ncbi:hypothetical protein MTO96_010003 [Rhipicephalus appendiculatus]
MTSNCRTALAYIVTLARYDCTLKFGLHSEIVRKSEKRLVVAMVKRNPLNVMYQWLTGNLRPWSLSIPVLVNLRHIVFHVSSRGLAISVVRHIEELGKLYQCASRVGVFSQLCDSELSRETR